MNKKTSLWIAIIIILILIGVAIYSSQKAKKIDYSSERNKAIEEVVQRPAITLNAKHQYRDGEHTFLGTLELPSPCHTYNAEVIPGEELTEIALTYEASNQLCAQVITERQFRVSFSAEEEVDVIATLNGETVNLNIFDVGPDEDLSEVEIFIKG